MENEAELLRDDSSQASALNYLLDRYCVHWGCSLHSSNFHLDIMSGLSQVGLVLMREPMIRISGTETLRPSGWGGGRMYTLRHSIPHKNIQRKSERFRRPQAPYPFGVLT